MYTFLCIQFFHTKLLGGFRKTWNIAHNYVYWSFLSLFCFVVAWKSPFVFHGEKNCVWVWNDIGVSNNYIILVSEITHFLKVIFMLRQHHFDISVFCSACGKTESLMVSTTTPSTKVRGHFKGKLKESPLEFVSNSTVLYLVLSLFSQQVYASSTQQMAPPSPNTTTSSNGSSSCGDQQSKTNLYIRGLHPGTTDQDLAKLCQPWVSLFHMDMNLGLEMVETSKVRFIISSWRGCIIRAEIA